MRSVKRFGPIAVLAVAAVTMPVFAGNVTVGRFYTAVAGAKHLVCTDAASAEANIRGAGFNLPQLALDKNLTEGDMTAISRALGVAVTTHRPSQPVSASQVDTYVSVFEAQLGARGGRLGGLLSTNFDDRGGYGGDHHDHDHDHDHSRYWP